MAPKLASMAEERESSSDLLQITEEDWARF